MHKTRIRSDPIRIRIRSGFAYVIKNPIQSKSDPNPVKIRSGSNQNPNPILIRFETGLNRF